ncbi:hypothetical protein DB32_006914 [Sandaracinus amylolyticus]|uniref:Uncharacterized protein n=1 Tax=Sandaracinus amylolyticus TaxID=927083 RepID=A0A0F6W844_9BACT|nr:hypothetical protein DB32_006914 [Sandaracinus amylolyticus]
MPVRHPRARGGAHRGTQPGLDENDCQSPAATCAAARARRRSLIAARARRAARHATRSSRARSTPRAPWGPRHRAVIAAFVEH